MPWNLASMEILEIPIEMWKWKKNLNVIEYWSLCKFCPSWYLSSKPRLLLNYKSIHTTMAPRRSLTLLQLKKGLEKYYKNYPIAKLVLRRNDVAWLWVKTPDWVDFSTLNAVLCRLMQGNRLIPLWVSYRPSQVSLLAASERVRLKPDFRIRKMTE